MMSRARRSSFCVAIPTGQLFVWQARMPRHPIAWRAELETAIPSAPSARDDQRDIGGVAGIEVSPRPRQSRQSGYGNIVAEDQRGRAGTAFAAVEDEVVDADSQGGIDVLFDVLGGEFEADRDASRRCAHLLGELSEVGCRTSRPLHDLVAARRARAL